MKQLITVLFLFVVAKSYSQSLGYEMRTNDRSYIAVGYGHFELRHRTDLDENRFTYRGNVKMDEHFTLSVPIHYKIEKHDPTLEPRFVYKTGNYSVWVQHEFWYDHSDNTAIAVDIADNNIRYRVGWDTSKTVRFRILVKL